MKTLEYNSKRLAKNTGVDERIAKRHRFIEHLKKSDANIQPQHMQSLSDKFPVVPPVSLLSSEQVTVPTCSVTRRVAADSSVLKWSTI